MKNKEWDKDHIIELLHNFAHITGHNIIEVTKYFDSLMPSLHPDLAAWMDKIYATSGGWYHRVQHGHDFASNFGDVCDKFGFEGAVCYPYELFKDFTTKHGIPFPGTEAWVKSGNVGAKCATEWMSLNIADVFTGGLAIYSTFKLYKKHKNGTIDKKSYIWASVGVGVKIVSGVTTHNPILIVSGLADISILVSNHEDAKEAFENFFDWGSIGEKAGIAGAGIATGAGVAAGVVGAVSAFGVASTGTAISTLSGVAATNATLAAIGGGSLATGGAGVLGGTIILSTGGAALGVVAAYGAYRYIKSRKQAS